MVRFSSFSSSLLQYSLSLSLTSGSESGDIFIWDRQQRVQTGQLVGHTEFCNAVATSPAQPNLFASVSDDQTIRLWMFRTVK